MMLFVVVAIAWLAIVAVFVAICGAAAQGDTANGRAAKAYSNSPVERLRFESRPATIVTAGRARQVHALGRTGPRMSRRRRMVARGVH
jgi:hypothetical protein